jgi:squalene-hopene/tetraprenyl-beta-curcumene cyclase
VNYLYGTFLVLRGLEAMGVWSHEPAVVNAAEWIRMVQNADGGWGETCKSYVDASLAGRGESAASQTAWGLIGLLAADGGDGSGAAGAIERGVRWLVERQEEDGQWEEPQFTGTGFPGAFYIKYHLYRNYWPLSALGRYASLAAD